MKRRRPRFWRLAQRLVPPAWRRSIADDLAGEAAENGHTDAWQARQSLAAGVRLWLAAFGDALRADFRHSVRGLWHAKGFALAAIGTFALGIGINVAVFSLIDRLMFRPLPFASPERLVLIEDTAPASRSGPDIELSMPTATRLGDWSQTLGGATYVRPGSTLRITDLGSKPFESARTSANLLDVLGIFPLAGRGFTPDRERPQSGPTEILVTATYWQVHLGASTDILERTFGTGTRRYRIVGVLPADFVVPSPEVIGAIDGLVVERHLYEREEVRRSSGRGPPLIARLNDGFEVGQAHAELSTITARVRAEFPTGRRIPDVDVNGLQSGIFLAYGPYLWLVIAAVAVVLLIACVNLATLLLARGRSRVRDAAVRATLGASPRRLMGSAAVDAIVLCLVASVAALFVCAWTQAWLLSIVPPFFRNFAASPLDLRLVTMTLAAAIVCGLGAAVAPALHLRRVDVLSLLGRGDGPGRTGQGRTGTLLVAVEAALCVLLVAAAAVTVRTFLDLTLRNPGFEVDGLYKVDFGFEKDDGGTGEGRRQRVRDMLGVLQRMPSTEGVAVATQLPIGSPAADSPMWTDFGLRGRAFGISADLFRTLGTSVLAGRSFTLDEVDFNSPVAIVNTRGAAALFPDVPLPAVPGREVRTPDGFRTIVGVVEDILSRPGEVAQADLFVPITSAAAARVWRNVSFEGVVRMAPGSLPDGPSVERLFREFHPIGGLTSVQSVALNLAPWLDQPRFQATLFGSLGAIALVVAVAGLYGVAAFDVARRRQETGIRMTLGASASHVRRDVILGALKPVLLGSATGLVVTWWGAYYLRSLIFDLDPREPWLFAVVALMLVTTTVVAAWLPARRAAKTDPAIVLRTT